MEHQPNSLWQNCLLQLQDKIPTDDFKIWLYPLQAEASASGILLYASNAFVQKLKFPLLALVISGGHSQLIWMKEDYSFFAMMSRLKYINRWALMRNSREENLSEHSLEVAMLSHALCTIGNKRFGKELNADRAALIGLYHDATEIITGDMPTPVKYFNSNIKSVYKEIEHTACEKLLSILPEYLREEY